MNPPRFSLLIKTLKYTLTLGILCTGNNALSQDYNFAIKGEYEMPGFSNSREYDDTGFAETIDPFSGGLKVVHQDLFIPGNGGMDISVIRYYNNLQSRYNPQSALYNEPFPPGTALTGRSVVGLGWDLHFGRIWRHESNQINANNNPAGCKIGNVSSQWNPVLELPDGTRKLLVNANNTSMSFTTTDFWIATCLPTSQNAGVGGLLVQSPDGTIYTFNVEGHPTGVGNGDDTKLAYLVTKIENRNGNYINISYKNTGNVARHVLVDKITSSDGRTVSFTYENETTLAARLKTISSGGQTVTYNYKTISSDTVNSFLDYVSRPDSSKTTYAYYNTSNDTVSSIGYKSLKSILNPYGLTTTYTYKEMTFGFNGEDKSWVIASKKTSGTGIEAGTWIYNYSAASTGDWTGVFHNNGCTLYKHVGSKALPSPTGNNINQDMWRTGTLVRKEVWTGSTAGCGSTLLEETSYEWVALLISNQNDFKKRAGGTNFFVLSEGTYAPRLAKTTITRKSTNFITEYKLPDTFGNPREIIEKQGSTTRIKNLTYKPTSGLSRWIPHLVATENIEGVNGEISYEYDTWGNLDKVTRYGMPTVYDQYSTGDIKTVTDANQVVTTYSQYYRGVPKRIDYPEDIVALRTVDGRGNITCSAIASLASSSGNNCETVVNDPSTGTAKTTFGFDNMNRVTSIITPKSTDNDVGISYTYSGGYKSTMTRGSLQKITKYNGMLKNTSTTYQSGAESYANNYTFDYLGRQKFASYVNSTLGNSFTYDQLNRPTKITHTADASSVNYVYETNNKVKITDEISKATTYEYLGYGSPDNSALVKVLAPEGVTTDIIRHKHGLVDYITQGGIKHDYDYNSAWQLTSENRPDLGLTTYGRDNVGNTTSKKMNNSGVTTFSYDGNNKLKFIDYPVGTPDVSYTYDARGNKKTSITGNASWLYNYDDNGNLIQETLELPTITPPFPSGGRPFWLDMYYAYNANDSMQSMTYDTYVYRGDSAANSLTVDYAPDAFGRPSKAGHFASNISYHPNGQLKNYVHGVPTYHYDNQVLSNDLTNGVDVFITQNTKQLPERFTVSDLISGVKSSSISDLKYAYDAIGNVKNITDYLNTLNNQAFAYDDLHRLKTASGFWGNSSSITYDTMGNITQKTLGTQSLTYNYDSITKKLNSVSGGLNQTFNYDDYSNIRSNGVKTFTYNDANHLVATSTGTNTTYDGNNKKIIESTPIHSNKVSFYGANGKLLRSWKGTFNQEFYIYLGDKIIAVYDPKPTVDRKPTKYIYSDLLGSPVAETNASGSILNKQDFKPFGETKNPVVANSTNLMNLGYTGHTYDPDKNLVYMQGRYYDPVIGRFMGNDSVGLLEGNIHSFNRYSYANNNPLKYYDPDGNLSLRITSAINVGLNARDYRLQTSLTEEYSKYAADLIGPSKLGKIGKRIEQIQDLEGKIDFIPDAAGPLDSASIADIVALDKKLAPYFDELNKKQYSQKPITSEEFEETLRRAIIGAGDKEGNNPIDGNPVRKEFERIYGTDEAGFVKRAIDNYEKSLGN